MAKRALDLASAERCNWQRLKAYKLVPEAYRQKFRNCRKENDQMQLLLVEEFKRCINSDVKSFLDEKEVET